MISPISKHLKDYLKIAGELPVTQGHLGSGISKDRPSSARSSEDIKTAANVLVSSMKAERTSRQTLFGILLGISISWFVLCAAFIVYLAQSSGNSLAIGETLIADMMGLGALLPFLHCVHQGKMSIDIFLGVFPSLGANERNELARSMLIYLTSSHCEFGKFGR